MRLRRVLVVDDHDQVSALIVEALAMAGYAAERARDGRQALDLADVRRFNVAAVDLLMPGLLRGEDVARILAGLGVQIVMMSGAANAEERLTGLPYRYLLKPFRISALLELVEAAAAGGSSRYE